MKKFMQYRWWFLFVLIIVLFFVKKDQWFNSDNTGAAIQKNR